MRINYSKQTLKLCLVHPLSFEYLTALKGTHFYNFIRNCMAISCHYTHGLCSGFPNGTIGNFTNGTIGSQWYQW